MSKKIPKTKKRHFHKLSDYLIEIEKGLIREHEMLLEEVDPEIIMQAWNDGVMPIEFTRKMGVENE